MNNAKIIPAMSKASNMMAAILIGTGDALLGLLAYAFFTSLAATAWQFAIANDPTLADESNPP